MSSIENQKEITPQDINKLLASFGGASKLLSTMIKLHTAGLKTLKEMEKSTHNIAKFASRDPIKNKAHIQKDLMRLKVLIAEITESGQQEAIVATELERRFFDGGTTATTQDKYNMEVA